MSDRRKEEEIPVTPEMIEAGTEVFSGFDRRVDFMDEVVALIYRRMEHARRLTDQGRAQDR
jgi:hypothetical protein